jgi:hypothetical protein
MGIFDFFKKKKIKSELEEKINFTEINNWIDNKKQEIKKDHKQPKKEINKILLNSVQEFEALVELLKDLDLTEKKAPERAKLIVMQNLYNFIDCLEKLILELKQLDSEKDLDSISLENFINKINSAFESFEKKSIMSFQKSTFLIGKELEKVKEIISVFFKSFNKTIKEQKESIEQLKIILIIKEKLQKIANLEKINSENKNVLLEIQEKTNSFEEKIQKLKDQIKKIKETQEYIEQKTSKEEFEKLKTTIVIEFQNLKDLIDFKSLSEIYHSIEEKMSLVKDYRENFKETFEKQTNESFFDLIDIKKIDKEPIKQKISFIEELKQKANELNSNIQKELTEGLEKEIQHNSDKIIELSSESSKQEKLSKKFEENREQIKQEIIEQSKDINLIIGS